MTSYTEREIEDLEKRKIKGSVGLCDHHYINTKPLYADIGFLFEKVQKQREEDLRVLLNPQKVKNNK